MRKEYDFSQMKGRKNPYAKKLKKQVTMRMGVDIIDYFKVNIFQNKTQAASLPYFIVVNKVPSFFFDNCLPYCYN